MFATVQAQVIDISKYDQLTIEQKAEFFGGMSQMRLQNESDFLKALVLGSQDANEVVRRRAVQRAAMSLLGLQQLAQSGRSAPIGATDLVALETALFALSKSADRETRASAVRALAAVRGLVGPAESLVIESLDTETDEELRANLIEVVGMAGQQSEALKKALVNRIRTAKGSREPHALAKAVNDLRLTEAVPALIDRVGDSPSEALIAIEFYGEAASAAKTALMALIADPSPANLAAVRLALETLAAVPPPPPTQPRNAFVDLIAKSSPQDKAPTVDTTLKLPTSAQPPAPKKATSPTSSPSKETPSSTPWSIIVVLIVAATGLLWLLVNKRK